MSKPRLAMLEAVKAKYWQQYWQQRCERAELELMRLLEVNYRKGAWIELAWRILDRGEVGPDEINYLLEYFKEITQEVARK